VQNDLIQKKLDAIEKLKNPEQLSTEEYRDAVLWWLTCGNDEDLDDEPEEKNPFHEFHSFKAKYATDEPLEMEKSNGEPETDEPKNLTLLDHLRRLVKPDLGE
jgi:hypothetical protein